MAKESAYFMMETAGGKHGVKTVKQVLDQLHGVTSVSINPQTRLVAVDYDSTGTSYEEIEQTLNKTLQTGVGGGAVG